MQEIRKWFDGPLALSGAISHGASILAAEAMGADFGYVGSAFIATAEALQLGRSIATYEVVVRAEADNRRISTVRITCFLKEL